MSELFEPVTQRSVTFRNRVGISPMCQYSAVDGMPNDWHFVHLASRAVGGAGLVIAEATGVEPIGRISPGDTGLWSDAHVEAWSRITRIIREHGAVAGVQIAHAGRKASTPAPWEPRREALQPDEGGWPVVGASAIPFSKYLLTPRELSLDEIAGLRRKFVDTARNAVAAGFNLIEIHAAHGYLLHSFYSPLSNHRTDAYGGSFDNRIRLLLEITADVREAIGDDLPLWVRISATDWTPGGWTGEDSVELAKRLKPLGVDAIDCSTGGNVPKADIPVGPCYQVRFAEQVRRDAGIATAAVGLIDTAEQAADIVRNDKADFVLIARQSLRDPYFPIHAARKLGMPEKCPPPKQYQRAFD